MSAERWQRVKEIVGAALEHGPAQREAFVKDSCGDDQPLAAEVRALLAHSEVDSSFLKPVSTQAMASAMALPEPTELVGRRIGRFTITGTIGSGGMGSVFRAEQDSPRRTVAIKIIRFGALNASSLRRFEFEAEVLGRLRHPGIVRILEAGTFDLGDGSRPYFAMELIEGRTITEFAAQLHLRPRECLRLLSDVCQAVQHAHQQGVMHRDLKPANILVDGDGRPRILDFGVARALDSSFGPQSMQTTAGELVGSLRSMSPEQLSGPASDVDTRADIYALGVIGYELLAGREPYDFKSGSVAEISHTILTGAPVPLGVARPHLRGDVATVIEKAMAREKEARYQAAAEFAADIERVFANEPIAARPPSAVYQLRKFAQRNRTLVGGTIATLLALVAGIALYAHEANVARDEAMRASRERDRAEAVSMFLTGLLARIDPNAHGQDVNIVALVDAAATEVDERFSDPLDRAAVHDQIGTIYYNLGVFEEARRHYEVAYELRRERLGVVSTEALMGENNLGLVALRTGQLDEAIARHRAALDGRTRLLGIDDPSTLVSMNNLAAALQMQGALDESRALLIGAMEIQRRVRGEQHPDTMATTTNLGNLLRRMGRMDEALTLHRRALGGLMSTLGDHHVTTLIAMSNLAGTLKRMRQSEEAEALYRKAYAGLSAALGDTHPDTLTSAHNLAQLLLARGANEEATDMSRRAVDGFRSAAGPQPDAMLIALKTYGKCLLAIGNRADAIAALEEAVNGYRDRYGDDDARTRDARKVADEARSIGLTTTP